MNAPVDSAMLAKVSLDDKYTLEKGRVFLTGTQALIRLPMLQRERDQRAGLNTAGFVSGYRGSPLGGLDQALWRAQKHLEAHHVKFQPGRQRRPRRHRHLGHAAGRPVPGREVRRRVRHVVRQGPGRGPLRRRLQARELPPAPRKHGGVLVLAGDDHAAKSSTLAHQSEHILKACCIPVLNPANVQDYLDFGLHGYAMSRYSGLWVGFKCVTDVVESGAVGRSSTRSACRSSCPQDFALPPGGLNIRWPDGFLEQESAPARLQGLRGAGLRARQRLDRIVWDSPARAARHHHHRQVLTATPCRRWPTSASTRRVARDIGLRVYKVAMTWPLEPQGARALRRRGWRKSWWSRKSAS